MMTRRHRPERRREGDTGRGWGRLEWAADGDAKLRTTTDLAYEFRELLLPGAAELSDHLSFLLGFPIVRLDLVVELPKKAAENLTTLPVLLAYRLRQTRQLVLLRLACLPPVHSHLCRS